MPGEVSVYPFVNAFPKTKHLPLLQFICKHIHVRAHSGWSPSSLYKNGTLGLPQFLTFRQTISARMQTMSVSVACVQVFMCACVWKHTPAVGAATMRRRFYNTQTCYVASSLLPMPSVLWAYLCGLRQASPHLCADLGMMRLAPPQPQLPCTGLCWLSTNRKLTICDDTKMLGAGNWFPGGFISCMFLRIWPRCCLLENAWKLLGVRWQGAVTRISELGTTGRVTTVPGDAALLPGGVYSFAQIGAWPRAREEGPAWGNVCRKACDFNHGIRINYR